MLALEGLDLRQGGFALTADLEITGPGVVAVLGPSGAGKSTLLAAIAGFLDPRAGCIRWDGRDITGLAPGARPVAMMFQDQNLFPHLTLAQNLGLAISPALRLGRGDGDRIRQILARVGLEGFEDRRPADLSGGQASRAGLARVLLQDRPVVLLDEPFASLGPALKTEMLDLVAKHLSHALVLMVTHDPEDARRVAERTVLVADGKATGPFETRALLDDPPPELAVYLGPRS